MLVGARTAERLESNLASLDIFIAASGREQIDSTSGLTVECPDRLHGPRQVHEKCTGRANLHLHKPDLPTPDGLRSLKRRAPKDSSGHLGRSGRVLNPPDPLGSCGFEPRPGHNHDAGDRQAGGWSVSGQEPPTGGSGTHR